MQLNLGERIANSQTFAIFFALGLGIALALALAALITFTSPAVAIAAVAALVAGAVILSNIIYGLDALIAIAVLLPFASLPVNVGFAPTLLDIALLLVFVMWIARALMRQDEAPFTLTALGAPLLGFMVLAVFSFVIGMSNAGLQIYTVRHFAEILLAMALYFVIVNTVNTRERLERVVRALILAGGISALLGILFYVLPYDWTIRMLSLLRVFKYPSGDTVLRFINDDPEGTLRAISTSVDPNVLGGLMILMGALAAPQVLTPRPLLPRPLTIGAWLAMFICLVLTFSRGALLGLGAALVVIALFRHRRIVPFLLAGAVLFYLLPWTQTYVSHLLDAFAGSDRATQMRLGEYKDALILISRYPFFGVGFLGSPDIDTYIGVSSVYLLMAEEMGLVGVAAFLLTMGLYYWHSLAAWLGGLKDDPALAPILLGITAALIGSMTAGLFDHYFFNLDFPHSVTLFWLFVGLGMVAIRQRKGYAAE